MLASLFLLATTATTHDAGLQKALSDFYGNYDHENSSWLQKAPADPDALQRTYSICLDKQGQVRGSAARFVAVCGNPSSQEGGAHVDVGLIDLYVLSPDNQLMFHLPQFAAGSWGIPGKVDIVQIGQHDHAFVAENNYGGMGQNGIWDHIVGVRNNQLTELAMVVTAFDNEGTGYCDPMTREEILDYRKQSGIELDAECIKVTYNYDFDLTSVTAGYADLIIQEGGEISGKPANRTFRVKFDKSSGTYPLPSALAYEI